MQERNCFNAPKIAAVDFDVTDIAGHRTDRCRAQGFNADLRFLEGLTVGASGGSASLALFQNAEPERFHSLFSRVRAVARLVMGQIDCLSISEATITSTSQVPNRETWGRRNADLANLSVGRAKIVRVRARLYCGTNSDSLATASKAETTTVAGVYGCQVVLKARCSTAASRILPLI